MKIITPYLLRFTITAAILTLVFRFTLSHGIENQMLILIGASSGIYGALMFVSGWIFGRKDSEYLPIFDIGFRFHLSTYIVHNLISLLWLGLGFGSQYESISITYMVAGYWGVSLIIHFIFYLIARKRSIDSLDKEDIFE